MELIYKNNYGASFKIDQVPNTKCTLQLVVDSIGLFFSEEDLGYLLDTLKANQEPCYCEHCQGETGKRLWCHSSRYEFGLILDEDNTKNLIDLIKGTQFLLNMDQTLAQYRLKTN